MADKNENPLPPLSTVPEDEQFVSPEAFMNADNVLDWDELVNRGYINKANVGMTRWERDSLYVKFDPLVTPKNATDRASFMFKKVPKASPAPPGGSNMNESLGSSASFNTASESLERDEQQRVHDGVIMMQPQELPLNALVDVAGCSNKTREKLEDAKSEKTKKKEQHSAGGLVAMMTTEPQVKGLVGVGECKKSREKVDLAKLEKDRIRLENDEQQRVRKGSVMMRELQLNGLVDECIKARERLDEAESEKREKIREREEANEDLRYMEAVFARTLMMYEEIKTCQLHLDENCQVLQARQNVWARAIEQREARDKAVEEHFASVLERMKQDFEARVNERNAENVKLSAKLRMTDMKTSKLETEIKHLDTENEKLRTLCEDLMRE